MEPSARKCVNIIILYVGDPCLDALDDGTDRVAERTASAGVLVDLGKVGLLVKRYGLVAGVVTGHVALP